MSAEKDAASRRRRKSTGGQPAAESSSEGDGSSGDRVSQFHRKRSSNDEGSSRPPPRKPRSSTNIRGGAEDAEGSHDDSSSSEESTPRRLEDILRALPEAALRSLIKRMGVHVDPGKRIDVPSQVARALVGLADVRDPTRLPVAARELVYRIAEAGGRLLVPSMPSGLEVLVARGMVFARKAQEAIELILPNAFVVQLHPWDGEDQRGIRALLAVAPFETLSSIATHYLGRPATPPLALSLEAAWEHLADERKLRDEIASLPPLEQRLLSSIEKVGGEVDTEELLDLEREPMRLRGAGGVSASRRGAGFSLERRGLLFPIHPNRHVVPSEVARIVGEDRRQQGEERRAEIRSFVHEEDHVPRRARFALDAAPLTLAIAIAAREPGVEVRPGVGTPRSLISKWSQRFGRDPEVVALVVALSRAIGAWDIGATSTAAPPGGYTLIELNRALFNAWHNGGAWDEGRPERELLRVPIDNREPSPARVLRDVVLGSLRDLGEGCWVPWSSLSGYLAADPSVEGAQRLLRRWAERTGAPPPDAHEIMRRIALGTLPALGVIDLGADTEWSEDVDIAEADAVVPAGLCLRLTPRGRRMVATTLDGRRLSSAPEKSQFIDTQAIRIGSAARMGEVLSLAAVAEVGRVTDSLELVLTSSSVAMALSAGIEGDGLRSRIEALATLPSSLSQMLEQASAVIGRASLVEASGFLWIDDPDLRDLLSTRRTTADLFVNPSPPGGLLLRSDVELDRLVRKCRGVGIEVVADGTALRARSPSQTTVAVPAMRGRKSSAQTAAVRPRTKKSSGRLRAIDQRRDK